MCQVVWRHNWRIIRAREAQGRGSAAAPWSAAMAGRLAQLRGAHSPRFRRRRRAPACVCVCPAGSSYSLAFHAPAYPFPPADWPAPLFPRARLSTRASCERRRSRLEPSAESTRKEVQIRVVFELLWRDLRGGWNEGIPAAPDLGRSSRATRAGVAECVSACASSTC